MTQYSTSCANICYDAVAQIRPRRAFLVHVNKLTDTKTQNAEFDSASVAPLLSACFLCHLLLTLDHTCPVSVTLEVWSQRDARACTPTACVCVQCEKAAWETSNNRVGDGGRVHCLCSFGSLNKVFVCAWMEGTQRCQLVMQQKSAQLDQSESLSHSPKPFCYITNMPFTKQAASCQTALNHRRGHHLTSASRQTSNYSTWRKTTRQRFDVNLTAGNERMPIWDGRQLKIPKNSPLFIWTAERSRYQTHMRDRSIF